MTEKIIDISPLINADLAVWPGDVAYRRNVNLSIETGANIDLSSIEGTVHLGAHADAPSHYVKGGEGIDQRDLSLYFGPAQVVAVDVPNGVRVRLEHIKVPVQAPRVLFKTGSYPDPTHFNADFCSLSPALIEHLAGEGVRLIGIDTPSIDPADSKDLPSHAMVATHDLAILEGIVLDHVEEGVYQLVAFPLRIEGADASPVRAVLIKETP
jgi:arylformamidase